MVSPVARPVGRPVGEKGGLAEQFVGQHLRLLTHPFEDPRLYYWQGTAGHQAEIDYIIQVGPHIIPLKRRQVAPEG